jgi:hypothetical protein
LSDEALNIFRGREIDSFGEVFNVEVDDFFHS